MKSDSKTKLFQYFYYFQRFIAPSTTQTIAKFHSIAQMTPTTSNAGGAWSLISVRTNIRDHFPRPREHKRVGLHGFLKRMSTKPGRRILMRRILRGRHHLSH